MPDDPTLREPSGSVSYPGVVSTMGVEEEVAMAPSGRFSFVAVDDPSAGGRLRAELREWLLAEGVNGSVGDAIVSSVTEAFVNAIEHPIDRVGGRVTVEGEMAGRELVFRVHDQGRWRERVDPTRDHYGYRLMEAQMDSVEVERGGSGTVVTLRRTI
jgi:anti-sigma regulatory factor (Ser/Thr protein kinase)